MRTISVKCCCGTEFYVEGATYETEAYRKAEEFQVRHQKCLEKYQEKHIFAYGWRKRQIGSQQ